MVKDPQGVIPGVTITLINEQTNVSRETTTNAVGEYSFPAVDPSAYTVRAVVAGFKTFERKGFRIGTQQDRRDQDNARVEDTASAPNAPLRRYNPGGHRA